MNKDALIIEGISKEYPGVKALQNVSLSVHEGEVLALIGENGAGKSTLVKMLSGAEHPDSGYIEINGTKYSRLTPAQAKELGIAMIYQEFNVFPDLTVAENLFLREGRADGLFVDHKEAVKHAQEVFEKLKVKIDVNTRVSELTTAYTQLVEIACAVSQQAKIIIMDEPTAPLSNDEVDVLFSIIKDLKSKGITIIYISHRLGEIFEISDRICVMRDGCKAIELETAKTNRQELIFHMVNRKLEDRIPRRNVSYGDVVLEANQICGNGNIKVQNVSFKLRAGEILGLGGLVGAGRTEVARLLFGADKMTGGEILLDGKKVKVASPVDANKLGIGMVPEDRKQHGVLLEMSIRHNISLPIIDRLSQYGFMRFAEEEASVQEQVDALQVKTPTLNQLAKNLSGGNQQKVVLAKWLARKCRVLILDEPTRGVDVGAKHEIYKLINALAELGIAIVLITTEMEEILGLSDRILVLCEGRSMGLIEREEFSQERVLSLASGDM